MGRGDATSLQYANFRSTGTAGCLTINIVFVPLFMRVPTPCANQPRSLSKAVVHVFLAGPRIRCMYSRTLHVEGSITELQKWVVCGKLGV